MNNILNWAKTIGLLLVAIGILPFLYKQIELAQQKLVREYAQSTNIILTDIIDIDGDNQFTFRMVGETNDLFSIDGISKDYALKLKEISEQVVSQDSKNLVKVPDEAGISNSMGLVMLGLLMTIIFLTLTLFKI